MMKSKKDIILENMIPGRESNMFVYALSEAEMDAVNDKIVATLYKSILEKYNYIDFGDILKSKGDITKFGGYESIKEVIALMRQLSNNVVKGRFTHLDAVEGSVRYLEQYKSQFVKGFMNEDPLITMTYNTILYSVLVCVDLLIAIYIDYVSVKGPNINDIVIKYKEDKTVTNYMVFKVLIDFNEACAQGKMDQVFAGAEKSKKFIGTLFAGATVFIGAVAILLPLIRNLIFTVYDSRMSVATMLENQAELLRLNASILEDNKNATVKGDRKAVIKKQKALADKLDKYASRIIVKYAESEKKGKKELAKKISKDELEGGFSNMLGGGFDQGVF